MGYWGNPNTPILQYLAAKVVVANPKLKEKLLKGKISVDKAYRQVKKAGRAKEDVMYS